MLLYNDDFSLIIRMDHKVNSKWADMTEHNSHKGWVSQMWVESVVWGTEGPEGMIRLKNRYVISAAVHEIYSPANRTNMGIAMWDMYSSTTSSQSIPLHPGKLQARFLA